MKKIIGIGLLVMSLVFVGCSKDEDSESATTGSITATINGTPWIGTKIINVSLIQSASLEEQRFDISAQDGKQMLALAISSDLTTIKGMPVHPYSFELGNALFLNSYIDGANTYTEHLPVSGQLTITAIDTDKKTISGTFSFQNEKGGMIQTIIVTPDVVNVTNGVFTNLTYTVITE
ncbi:DUF6252 family protein [Flavobacterium granuli]|uniref:Lipocalin-like domain-containing protein n=1 Tax=Flavobacterium granuli TaxID=280093 RepID=A0ABU1S6S7_9FLAO|nr:DUF6252 family protein [Flavobacterium granuli]MDR6845884.1 hypothetical protein [Flavobacterium granuli]